MFARATVVEYPSEADIAVKLCWIHRKGKKKKNKNHSRTIAMGIIPTPNPRLYAETQ